MFPATYFAPRFFPVRFFPKVGSGGVAPTQAPSPYTSVDGTTLFVPFDQDVVGVVANQYVLGGGHTLSTPVGSGSGGLHGTVWSFTISPPLICGEVLLFNYAGASTKNFSNNLLATFSGHDVTNNVPLSTPIINVDGTEASVDATRVAWFTVAGATGYDVQRSTNGSSWGSPVDVGGMDQIEYDDTTTVAGITYFYRIRAHNDVGVSAYSSPTSAIMALGPVTFTEFPVVTVEGVRDVTLHMTLRQGATFVKSFYCRDPDDNLVDLTGFTARMMAKAGYDSDDPLISITDVANGQGQVILGSSTGRLVLRVESSHTDTLAAADLVYDVELVAPNGDVTRILEGHLLVSPQVTR